MWVTPQELSKLCANRASYPSPLATAWLITIALGGLFMYGTAEEWRRLIVEHGLTISTNLFGTTYYSLVGLHAFHVTVGLVMLAIVLVLGVAGKVRRAQSPRVGVLSL